MGFWGTLASSSQILDVIARKLFLRSNSEIISELAKGWLTSTEIWLTPSKQKLIKPKLSWAYRICRRLRGISSKPLKPESKAYARTGLKSSLIKKNKIIEGGDVNRWTLFLSLTNRSRNTQYFLQWERRRIRSSMVKIPAHIALVVSQKMKCSMKKCGCSNRLSVFTRYIKGAWSILFSGKT